MNPYYKDYGEYLAERFPGRKMQKISVNAGFSCPNRDGSIGRGGCIYCDNSGFTPSYCFSASGVKEQLEAGKRFFAGKYPEMKYLAYFQSYTNTFLPAEAGKGIRIKDIDKLEKLYRDALSVEDVEGLIIGSRPDCFPGEVVDLLERLNRERSVIVEIGAETSHDTTLSLINRGHSWEHTVSAVRSLADRGISVGLHLICGLPGENEEMIMETVRKVCELPVDTLKFHHLQIIKGTPLAKKIEDGDLSVALYDPERYADLCMRIIDEVPREIAIERFVASAPPEKVLAPKWGMKNYQFTNLLINKLRDRELHEAKEF